MKLFYTLFLLLIIPWIMPAQCPDGWEKPYQGQGWILDIFSFNDSTVLAGGTSRILIKTFDGGDSWDSMPPKKGGSFYDIDFINQAKGWTCGGSQTGPAEIPSGMIHYKSNKGEKWGTQLGPSDTSLFLLASIDFVDNDTGWAVGSNIIIKTINGGEKWVAQQTPFQYQAWFSVHFKNSKEGWISGDEGIILHTNNGGKEWDVQPASTEKKLRNMHFENPETGWVVGNSGTIRYTTDGGETWLTQNAPTDQNLTAVHFIDTNRGYIAGENGTLLHTNNGGQTWLKKPIPTDKKLRTIRYSSDSIVWAGGNSGNIFKYTASKPKTSFEYTIHGNTVQFHNTSIPNSNFRWHFGNDSTSQAKSPSHTYKQNGVYEVCLIGEKKCGNDTTCRTLQVEKFGSTKNSQSPLNCQIYPQPVENKARIQYQVDKDLSVTFQLLNGRGQIVKRLHWHHSRAGTQTKDVPFENLPKGIYYYRLQTTESEQAGKILHQ